MALVRNAMSSVVTKIAKTPSLRNALLAAVKISDPNLAHIYALAHKYQAVDKIYRFESIGEHHVPHLMDMGKGFFEDESLNQATGSTIENCKNAFEYMIANSIAAQHVVKLGYICYDNGTNKPVGFRFAYPVYRDPTKAPFICPPEPTFGPQEVSLVTPLDECFDKIWSYYPNEDVVVKGDIVYIDRTFRRRDGLYNVLVDYGMDFPTMAKQSGANYYVPLCTAMATKVWFSRLGYTHVYSTPAQVKDVSGKQVKLPHGEMHLFAANLHTMRGINVRPVWEKMKDLGIMEK